MRFLGQVTLTAKGEVVRREPGFWDRFKAAFSRDKTLDRGRAQALMTTAHLLAGVKGALERVGITNAVRLVIDGHVLFEDTAGRADDVGDLFRAFYENEALYGREFKALALTVEHRDAGLHTVIGLTARGDSASDTSRIEVVASARIADLAPLPGDDPSSHLARAQALMASPAVPEAYRLRFERFAESMRDALASALADVEVSRLEVESRLVKPRPLDGRAKAPPAPEPSALNDPYEHHYPDRSPPEVLAATWAAALGWAWHPEYRVVYADGTLLGPLPAQLARPAPEADEAESTWVDEDTFEAEPSDLTEV